MKKPLLILLVICSALYAFIALWGEVIGEIECCTYAFGTTYSVRYVVLPFDKSKTAMLLFSLDMKGIAVSRGSACQSGSTKPSHVLAAFLSLEEQQKPNIRISMSHFNTKEEIDYLINVLKTI